MVKNTCYKGPGFDSQHPHGGSPPPQTPVAHVVHRCTPIHIKRNLRKRKKGGKEEERRERKKRKRGK